MTDKDDNKGGAEISVTVYYGAGEKTKEFRRNATVQDVLVWAITAFAIDPSMASEFELARHGEKEELADNVRLATLVRGNSSLALDLLRGDIANGAGE